jgi:hypothetical protein
LRLHSFSGSLLWTPKGNISCGRCVLIDPRQT